MRELTQEEFDEILARRAEVWSFIKFGSSQHLNTFTRNNAVLPRQGNDRHSDWEDLINRPNLSRTESFYDFGSKYIVHYEDLSEVDI